MKKVLFVLSIVIVIIASLMGCGLLVEHRIQEDLKRIPLYEINQNDTRQVINNGKVYQITNIKLERIQVRAMMGRIRKVITINEEYQVIYQTEISIKNIFKIAETMNDKAEYVVPYLNIYEIEGENSQDKIAIEINGLLYMAVSIENDISSYPIIEYH